jgi:hypothetical protein
MDWMKRAFQRLNPRSQHGIWTGFDQGETRLKGSLLPDGLGWIIIIVHASSPGMQQRSRNPRCCSVYIFELFPPSANGT